LRWISMCRHAIAITPVGPLGISLLARPIPTGRLFSQQQRPSPHVRWVGTHVRIFEACSAFTRVTACLLAMPPCGTLSRRLRRFCCLHRRSDSYRLERPSCRVGIAPTEEPHLFTAHGQATRSQRADRFPVQSSDQPQRLIHDDGSRSPGRSVVNALVSLHHTLGNESETSGERKRDRERKRDTKAGRVRY
jgi:hypothetical protein